MAYDGLTERRHSPLTEEQLALISHETEHAVRKGLKHQARRSIIGFLVLLAANIFVWSTGQAQNSDSREAIVQSGKVVSISGCNRDFQTIKSLRGVLISAQTFQIKALERGDISQAQFDRAQTYYDDQLAKLTLPDCRVAGEILTSETDEIPQVPVPLHP